MTVYTRLLDVLRDSVCRNETISLPYRPAWLDDLIATSDDYVEDTGGYDFWGTLPSGGEWRVRMPFP